MAEALEIITSREVELRRKAAELAGSMIKRTEGLPLGDAASFIANATAAWIAAHVTGMADPQLREHFVRTFVQSMVVASAEMAAAIDADMRGRAAQISDAPGPAGGDMPVPGPVH